MDIISRPLHRLLHVLQAYGVTQGIGVYFALRRRTPRVSLPLPGKNGVITLRPRTTDVSVFEQVFVEELYDGCAEHAPQVVVDAGAHIGCAALFFARSFPEAQIVAVEPERSNFALLTENTSSDSRIQCLRAALWSHDGVVQLQADPQHSTWGHHAQSVEGERRNEDAVVQSLDTALGTVECVTVPALMRRFGMSKIDLLKVDIEGAERQVFGLGCQEWLPKVGSLVIELHERMYPGCLDVVSRALDGFSGRAKLLHE